MKREFFIYGIESMIHAHCSQTFEVFKTSNVLIPLAPPQKEDGVRYMPESSVNSNVTLTFARIEIFPNAIAPSSASLSGEDGAFCMTF